jgi:hypothetical protein
LLAGILKGKTGKKEDENLVTHVKWKLLHLFEHWWLQEKTCDYTKNTLL